MATAAAAAAPAAAGPSQGDAGAAAAPFVAVPPEPAVAGAAAFGISPRLYHLKSISAFRPTKKNSGSIHSQWQCHVAEQKRALRRCRTLPLIVDCTGVFAWV